jgi:alanyl-tRNA synthetase
VWQAGAYKGPDLARIDVTHFRALTDSELRAVDLRVNRIIRENREVRSYFESRAVAEQRFGFTLYQGGAVPGGELRIVEVPGFDVEACGGTHCTRTGEVGFVSILASERIQDGVVRLVYAAGDRSLELQYEHESALRAAAQQLGVAPEHVPQAVVRLFAQLEEARKLVRTGRSTDLASVAERLSASPDLVRTVGPVTIIAAPVEVDAAGMQELCRRLTASPGRVAILTLEIEGRGRVIVGSSAPSVSARSVLDAMTPRFQGKGGGHAGVATASGEPGAPLQEALRAGTARATELATAGAAGLSAK